MIATLRAAGTAAGLLAAAILVGCNAGSALGLSGAGGSGETGVARLEPLAETAARCWMRSRDPAFSDVILSPELGSPSGRPRILLVPRSQPTERPRLVVQGFADSSEVMVYGPLLGQDVGRRIEADLARWKAGDLTCMPTGA